MSPGWRLPSSIRAALLLVAALLLAPASAPARPGGGHNFSSGGSPGRSFHGTPLSPRGTGSSGFGGTGYSGGGDSSVSAGTVLVILLVVLIVAGIAAVGAARAIRDPDRTTQRAIAELSARRVPGSLAGLAGLRKRDPAFDPDRFLARARSTADAVNRAWLDEQLAAARRILSDSVYLRFRTQLELNRKLGVRNVMADYGIVEVAIARIESDADWDTIHVKLTGRARDADVPASLPPADAEAMARKRPLEEYYEIWSLLRRTSAKTLEKGGALEGRCPSCGADVPPSDVTRCEYCKTLVNSGVFDWVLAEITQISEWSPAGTGGIPGLDPLRARDPGVNREQIEDRASLLFWKWIEARILGDGKRLARFAVAAPEGLGVEAGKPAALDRVAVGSADLVACDPEPGDGKERCYVKIVWSAAPDRGSEPAPISSILVLARTQGVTTTEGLSSLSCRECRGPLAESDSPICEYCGAKVSAGEQEWALEAVTSPQAAERLRAGRAGGAMSPSSAGGPASAPTGTPAGSPAGAIDIPDLGDPRERLLLLFRIAALIAADGAIQPRERELLETMARRWGVPIAVLAPAMQPGAGLGPLVGIAPADREPFLAALVIAALVDGRVDTRERQLLDAVAKSLDLPPSSVDELIRAGGRRASAATSA